MFEEASMLTNFRVPLQLRNRFDSICAANGRSRTSVLVQLMSNYVLNEGLQLASRTEDLLKVDRSLSEIREMALSKGSLGEEMPNAKHTVPSRSYGSLGPIPIRYSDGQEDW